MKAAILKGQNKLLSVENIAIPELEKEEILVRVVACGVCHTDLHYIDHGVPTFKQLPIVLGHEISGIIAKTKSEKFKKGDKVLIPAVLTCGKCVFCLSGRSNICKHMKMPGNHINGGFAEYIKVPAKDIVILPDEIPLEEGCIIADAISTPYHAVVNRAKVRKNQNVLVIGCGGVGINVVQIASMLGANVFACDIDNKKLETASELGAKYTVNPNETSLKEFLKAQKTRMDVSFEVIGNPETIELAYKMLGISGKLCVIGYTNKDITINPAKIMFFEQEIIGSCGCPVEEYPKIIELVRQGKINLKKLISNKYDLDNINTAFDELRTSKVLRNIILPQ